MSLSLLIGIEANLQKREVKAGQRNIRQRKKSRSQNTSTPRTHSFRATSCDAERKIFFAESGRMRIGWLSMEGDATPVRNRKMFP
jgi:hypothetical protein